MTVTNGDILDYVLANRMHLEDGEYALQEKAGTMGADAVGSARIWLQGRFLAAGETATFRAFIVATWGGLDAADLVDLETIRAAYYTDLADDVLTETYMLLFDALVRLTIAYIWVAAGMEGEGDIAQGKAQELISAIVGSVANPDNVTGGDGGDIGEGLPSTIVVSPLTDTEISALLGNYS